MVIRIQYKGSDGITNGKTWVAKVNYSEDDKSVTFENRDRLLKIESKSVKDANYQSEVDKSYYLVTECKVKRIQYQGKDGMFDGKVWVKAVVSSDDEKSLTCKGNEKLLKLESCTVGKANYQSAENKEYFLVTDCQEDGRDMKDLRSSVSIEEEIENYYWIKIRKIELEKDRDNFITIKSQTEIKEPKVKK